LKGGLPARSVDEQGASHYRRGESPGWLIAVDRAAVDRPGKNLRSMASNGAAPSASESSPRDERRRGWLALAVPRHAAPADGPSFDRRAPLESGRIVTFGA